MRAIVIAIASATLACVAGCGPAGDDTASTTAQRPEVSAQPSRDVAATQQSTGAELGTWGVELDAMDREIAPGDDFYRFVNGTWLDTSEIPGDRSRWGAFHVLRERSTEQVLAIVEDLRRADAEQGSVEQKVGDFYDNWMDTDEIEALGAAPLKPELEKIAAIEDKAGLTAALASLHHTAPVALGIIPDPADTTRYIVIITQAGLGMPDREYYLSEDQRFVAYRDAYRDYIIRIHELAGIPDAENKAAAIIDLETSIAEQHWTRADSRVIEKIYNPMSRDELKTLAPQVDWDAIMTSLGLGAVNTVLVAQPSAVASAAVVLDEKRLELWKDYLTYHYIRTHARFLSEAFDTANFDFFSGTLRGIEEQRDRDKRGADLINARLGEAVGKIYVQRHFPPESKELMDDMVRNLLATFGEMLKQNEWMDEQTRAEALKKLSTFEPRIGYPSKWTDYGPLDIRAGDLLGNARAIAEFTWSEDVKRLGGPVDRDIWPYPPQTVNASYNPLLNQLTFPAGILQPPFFDPRADVAVNYGAIGAVIGHEMGHGFDDQGREFDDQGRIRDWWTERADERYQQRVDLIVPQYNAYSPVEGMNVNGELTLGENLGDLGGLEMAYSAYRRHVAENGEPPILDGFTGDQRFFLAWAQLWRQLTRDEALREQLITDPHSPNMYRVNGIVRNMDAWYEAFGVTEENALYLPPEERVSLWM